MSSSAMVLSGGAESLPGASETSVAAVAEQARAMVEARFLVALRRPRDIEDFRARLLKDCQRPGFAEVAIYKLPRGGKTIEGPSIRFIESAVRSWGNVDSMTQVVYEDDEKLILRAVVTDLETNATYSSEQRVSKTVERKQKPKNEAAIQSTRFNSYGDLVYLLPATDDELAQKINSVASRMIRTNGLRLIPGDIVEEACNRIRETLKKGDAADPDAARRKISDAFVSLGINPSDLAEYLGHALDQCGPAEITELRAVYASLRDGQTTWGELVEARRKESGAPERDEAICDDKDMAKLRKMAEKRAAETKDESITADTILADLGIIGEDAKPVLKAELPGAAKAVSGWQPGGAA